MNKFLNRGAIPLFVMLSFAIGSADAQNGKVHLAGKVTDKTRYIDCDRLYPFSMGAAVIQKGNAFAMIDAQGGIVVPFNRYNNIHSDFGSSKSSFFYATKIQNGESVYLTSKGKEVASATGYENGYFFQYAGDKKFLVAQKLGKDNKTASVILIDAEGKRTQLALDGVIATTSSTDAVADSAIVYRKNDKYGFKNFDGTGVSPQFDHLEPFSCGVAVFGKVNETGQLKYGIINRQGKTIFPAQLTYIPSQFQYGATLLRPSGDAAFRTAVVNTQGEVVYKNTDASIDQYGQFMRFTPYFVLSNTHMLDKKGNVTSHVDFLNKIGVAVGKKGGFQTGRFTYTDWYPNIVDSFQRFTVTGGSRELKGFYNPMTGEVLICNMSTSSNPNWGDKENHVLFDNVSGLGHVILEGTSKDGNVNGKPIVTDGYIDRKGEFAIIRKAAKSDW